jgi:nucleoside-diphosphate-sugar epimerase
MQHKRVIVTGGTGFIGRQTIPFLIDRGYRVHSVGRGKLPLDLAVLERRHPDHFQHRPLELLDPLATTEYLKEVKASHLLHLAWDTRHGLFWTSPENTSWLESSRSLISSFIEHGGSRIVGAGTCAEYEWEGTDLVENKTPLRPSTPYGKAKLALRDFIRECGVSNAWGRVFHLFGPYETDKRLVSSACLSLLKGEPFAATKGTQVRDFSSTVDVAEGFVALLDSQVTGDINIASGEARTIADILTYLGKLAGRPELIRLGEREAPPHDPPRITASVARLHDDVGFRYRTSGNERLAETFEWWKIHGLTPGR